MSASTRLKRLVPRGLREARGRALRRRRSLLDLLAAYLYDLRRYLRYSSSNGPYGSRENLRSKITATYHNVEKGLSLPDPRPGFGVKPVGNLVRFVRTYVDDYGYDEWVATPLAVLRSYRDFTLAAGAEVPSATAMATLLAEADATIDLAAVEAGVRVVHRQEVADAVDGVDMDFFTSRASVRQYEPKPVPAADIEFAAAAAQRAPAVCNRQYNRIYVHQDKDEIARILEVQGGARGFGPELGGLAIITSDLRNFWDAGERNQAWIDGGLFAMSFVYGLHARGLGTVCLNWSKPPATDLRLREVADLPDEAAIIMLVGFGVLREEYRVARSGRIPVEQVLDLR